MLTTDLVGKAENLTTFRVSYKKPEPCGERLVGKLKALRTPI